MEQNIVGGLFGITPEMYQQNLARQELQQGINLSSLSPGQAANAMLYAAGSQLGRGIGSLLGAEDPTLQKVTAQSQILQGLNLEDPNVLTTAAQRASQAGIPELALRLLAIRDDAAKRQLALLNQQQTMLAQNLVQQLKNPDNTINEEVKAKLMATPQGRAAISEVAKVIPDLRRIGATGGQEDNPFAVFINDPTIPTNVKTTAQQYANSLKSGVLDPEKVDARVKELSDATQRAQQFQQNQDQIAEFKRQGLENSRQSLALQSQNQQMMQQNMAFNQSYKNDQLQQKIAEANKKPLPAHLSKYEEEDFDFALTATNLATDAYVFINQIKAGDIKFGLKDKASIMLRSATGSSDPDVLARQNYDKFIQRMTSENLRMNKGTQTDKDFERELALLKSAESPLSAAKIMQNLVDINVRKAKNADESIARRRTNAGFQAPEVKVQVPSFEPHVFDNAEYNSFLKNPKYPSGTVFIDPDGVRRRKP